ncbi:alpha/beta-hydrolase [Rhizopogon vinicolor AM-OR11-026]|uniref:Alpha/beta-hydrolase n=1 Tax=Rhizopogon vinicolor AM-OR11-026 TaxID=1314800 RepID=A0A1B7MWA2_9AGAM|nr:alpha/beta-hydrolase [Rhizopogon vinicolor AM-OR11-026]
MHVLASIPSPRVKPAPQTSSIRTQFSYFPSDDGTDENLLILLHGLGDTNVPFARLGRSLKLPQTATLALLAPEVIPFLYEEAFQWYPSFDQLGDLIERPNPTPALNLLKDVLNHLTGECGWPPHRIHFFGFAQGGSVAAEACLQWWRRELELSSQSCATDKQTSVRPLGSLVTVSGPLLSYPTLSKSCETPVLVFHRQHELKNGTLDAFRKGFSRVKDVECVGEGMPRASSREEWQPIMQFWSEVLGRRPADGLYEVRTGVES